MLLLADTVVLLWNPATRCSTKFLEPLPYPEDLSYGVLAGLCYDSCTRDYTAVLLLRHDCADQGRGDPFVISASLKNKKWRSVQFPYNLNSARGGVEYRNTFHWWVSDIKHLYYDEDFFIDWEVDYPSGGNRIVYFDLEDDEFRSLPTP